MRGRGVRASGQLDEIALDLFHRFDDRNSRIAAPLSFSLTDDGFDFFDATNGRTAS